MPHRLDVYTSGLVLFIKNKNLNKDIDHLFKNREIEKKYQAISHGLIKESKKIEIFLKEQSVNISGKKQTKMVTVKSGGKKAITEVHPIESNENYTLIDINLMTGRKHQIRASLSHIGHPIKGDKLYGSTISLNDEQKLHAYFLKFKCPLTNKEIAVHSKKTLSLKEDEIIPHKSLHYYLFYKPFNVLSQFTRTAEDEKTLKDFIEIPHIYPVGRLDKDSEGLILLTNDGDYQNQLAHSENKVFKTYIVQVEGDVKKESINELENGVTIQGKKTLPAKVKRMDNFTLKQRIPPIRERKNIPTSILEIKIREGRNRQIRRMTAKIGHPTLRLIRYEIGPYILPKDLEPGELIEVKKLS